MRNILKLTVGTLAIAVATSSAVSAAVGSLSVIVPKTAYIQFLATSADAMTAVNGGASAAFADYTGGAMTQLTKPSDKDTFIGVMCNSLDGYDVTLLASNASPTATTGKMTITGGTALTYTASLSKVTASFASGATATPALDLTGATVSATAVFAAAADLPLTAAAPNVWKLTYSLPAISGVSDGLIMSGTYSGGVTATVALK